VADGRANALRHGSSSLLSLHWQHDVQAKANKIIDNKQIK
jgi:hypothetical protein